MIDVTEQILGLQPFPLLQRDPGTNSTLVNFKEALNQRDGIENPSAPLFNKSSLDGLDIKYIKFNNWKVDPSDVGKIYALDRQAETTRLFFVWVPQHLSSEIQSGKIDQPLNFHLLFHPPTYESCYLNTKPYWNGKCKDWRGEGCDPSMQDQPLYVKLGLRYLYQDFRVIAHHLMAAPFIIPNLIYVVPVSDNTNFKDLIQPSKMLDVFREISEFLLKKQTISTQVGKVIISVYSRSGDRLEKMMLSRSTNSDFFRKHLSQINAFDINLGSKSEERLTKFKVLWEELLNWKSKANSEARIQIYTAYRDHADHILNFSGTQKLLFVNRNSVNFDETTWSDESLKGKGHPRRGVGIEAYNADSSVSLVHIPVTFFEEYITNNGEPVGNALAGYRHKKFGHPHGHGWFLRTLMSHALRVCASGIYLQRPLPVKPH
ncbi:hypothetical protein NIES2119_18050 [[Phormidium ambiguum] IAM M-71]|uniref:Uncharacterized protein n=1 Tax=[Phormidium ambiguum] IAM M-71 TaxID=454136 RepID=A0A1U7IGQ6_9CYAN|nr:hypothetical protein [Phormidium ambiguum]OKH36207.1 hypothetical protein NIES2119_18050 [Phormidium ambiguum IAM M-71]